MNLDLSRWGLPPLIVAWFRKKGVTHLFPWQLECLQKQDVLSGGNLVYSAPTSAGKSLVAEFLLIKKVLDYGKKALFIEPFVATTKEKAVYLKSMFGTTKARVGAFAGTYYTPGGITAVSIAVCTIEKANNIINKLIAENKLSDLGIIVVDEIHHVGDEHRGYLIELILTKILYYNSKQDKRNKVQIVGLSATVPNLETLAVWLQATLYYTDYRPVPLVEKIKLGNKVYIIQDYLRDPNCKPVEIIYPSRFAIKNDIDDLYYLCIDSISNGHSILVFCDTKRECEILSTGLAAQIKISGGQVGNVANKSLAETAVRLRSHLSSDKIKDVLTKLKKCPAGPDKELVKALYFGAAFHHAGLTSEEREIIEDGFKNGAIKALMATSTLSSGVNLPARRVVIRSPTMISSTSATFTKEMLNPITYKQMIGRAGRKNIDSSGESILICNSDNRAMALDLVRSVLGDIRSALGKRMMAAQKEGGEPGALKRAILEVIANMTAESRQQIDRYLKSSLWLLCAELREEKKFMAMVTETIKYLVENKFIEEVKKNEYKATRLGIAVLSAGLNPDDSLDLVKDLIKAQGGFMLNNDLHIIFQITPYDISYSVNLTDWLHYSNIWNSLDPNYQLVGQRVGIDEDTIFRKCQGYMRSMSSDLERVYKRFWVALAINDLINEVPLPSICSKYRMTKAIVQQVQRQVAQFAGVISIFCQELGYENIAALVKPLELRINFSCQRDLLELIKLNLNRQTARTLHKAGYRTIISLAKADAMDVEFVIRQTKPFRKDVSFTEKDAAPSIWVPELARDMTTFNYASHIVDSAKAFFQMEYEIDIPSSSSQSTAAKPAPSSTTTSNGVTPKKLARISEDTQMPDTNKEEPNFVVSYMDDGDTAKLTQFVQQWQSRSSISLGFKEITRVRESVGRQLIGQAAHERRRRPTQHQRLQNKHHEHCLTDSGTKSRSRSRSRSRSTSQNSTLWMNDDYDDLNNNDYNADDHHEDEDEDEMSPSQKVIRNGLRLRLNIDNTEIIVTHMYACFDQDMEVFVFGSRKALEFIRDNLAFGMRQNEREIPLKLYCKDIVSTYKILNAAFNMDRCLLNNSFEWHGYDVAWWMIQNCSNRGLNNKNSSLSLITKTQWAERYHHFLYRKSGRNRQAMESRWSEQSNNPNIRFVDIVKSGKTAILQPLIDELVEELRDRHQLDSYGQAEIPSRLAIAEMMVHGMGIDVKTIRNELNLYGELSSQLEDIAQRYYTKSSVSLTSIREVARVLYDELDLRRHLMEHKTISNIGKDPTNSEILTILAEHHPFPKMVQDFRKLAKAREALQSVNTHMRYDSDLSMYRVFGKCDFWQLTGRVSMFDPDLFLINRNFSVTIPKHGRIPADEVINCSPRKCFVPFKQLRVTRSTQTKTVQEITHSGDEPLADGTLDTRWILISADYSQLELRLLAHFSNDTKLLEILNRSSSSHQGYDVFKTIATKIYKKSLDQVSEQMRQHTKQICYGIIYGMGNTTLANHLGVDIEEAQKFRDDFFEAFPTLNLFTENLIKQVEEVGYVESILGRRRTLTGFGPQASSSARSRAERQAINTRIQSSASDLIKLAIRIVNDKILSQFENTARMVLEMHDELIFEVHQGAVDSFVPMLKASMEKLDLLDLRVHLLVNLKKGFNWSKMETI